MDAVVDTDLSALSVEQLQAQYAAVAPVVQRLDGYAGAVLAELSRRGGGKVPAGDGRSRTLAGWAAEASGASPSAAGRAVVVASALQAALPQVAQAVLDGTVPLVRAEVLTRLVGRIDQQALTEAEPGLLVTARLMDPVQLGDYVRHLIAQWVEPVMDDAERRASDRRYLKTRREQDGSLWGSFLLHAGDSEALLTVIEPLARPAGAGEPRSAAQRRADALVEVCEQVLRHGGLPESGGQRAQLSYVLPADWAARRADEHGCGDCVRCPQHAPVTFAELVAAGIPTGRAGTGTGDTSADEAGSLADGTGTGTGTDGLGPRLPVTPADLSCAIGAWSGPQTRARIETLLCDARISRVLLDRLGQVRGLESLTDTVTPAQRRALAARDVRCVARGCTRPPAMCDAHHLTARTDGGATTMDNLVLLCRRHHVLWHLGKLSLHDLHVPWLHRRQATDPPQGPPAARHAVESYDLLG